MSAQLRPGQSIRIEGTAYLCDRDLGNGTWLLTNYRTMQPRELSKSEFDKGYFSGVIDLLKPEEVPVPGYNPALACFGAIAEKAQEKAKLRLAFVDAIEKLEGPHTAKTFRAVIERVAKKLGIKEPSLASVYRWRKRYLPSNDIRSLVSNTYKKKKAKRFPEAVLTLAREVIESEYLTPAKNTVAFVHAILRNRIKELNLTRSKAEQYPTPSKATVGRLIQEMDAYDVLVARHGKKYADKHMRVYGRGPVSERPLQRVEVDHTLLGIQVVCGATGLALGRPTFTVALDHYSRMPLGFYVGFEVPSNLAVALCMRNAILPKAYLDDLFEGDEYPLLHEWPAGGVWHLGVFDNGREFHSRFLESACLTIGTNAQFMPAGAPHFKGSVERFMRTIQDQLIRFIPGATGSSVTDKGERKPELEACVTIEELIKIIHRWIIDEYNVTVHRTLGDTPLNFWRRGVEQYAPTYPEQASDLDSLRGGVERRAINTYGIELHGLKYSDPKLLSGLLRKPNPPKDGKWEIRFDPSDLGSILILDHETLRYETVPAVAPEYAVGLSLHRHEIIKRETKANKGNSEDPAQLAATYEKLRAKAQEYVLNQARRKRMLGKKFARMAGIGVSEVSKVDHVALAAVNHVRTKPSATTTAAMLPKPDAEADELMKQYEADFDKGVTL